MYDALLAAFAQQHTEARQLVEKLRKSVSSYKKTTIEDERLNTGKAISQMFTEFMETTMTQMENEETVLNKVL
jgi:hypothetical protein